MGWTKPLLETNFATLGLMIAEIGASRPQSLLFNGLTLTEGGLRDAWDLKDPVTGKVINATCALLGQC